MSQMKVIALVMTLLVHLMILIMIQKMKHLLNQLLLIWPLFLDNISILDNQLCLMLLKTMVTCHICPSAYCSTQEVFIMSQII